jgi:hypothetical protein
MTALRILNLIIWGALLVYTLPAAFGVIAGKDVRRADPWRLSVASVCIVIILGNLRWLIAPTNETLFALIYVLTAIVGVYKFILVRTYGRGPRL